MKYVIEYIYLPLLAGRTAELMELAVVEAENKEHALQIAAATGDMVLHAYLKERGGVPYPTLDSVDLKVVPMIAWVKMRLDVGNEIIEECQDPTTADKDDALSLDQGVLDQGIQHQEDLDDVPQELVQAMYSEGR